MRRSLLLLAVVLAGGLLGLQARVNGELGRSLHSAIAAALVSFGGGTLLLAVAVCRRQAAVRRLRAAQTVWWWWLATAWRC